MIDIVLALALVGGTTFDPAPYDVEGLFPEPSVETLSSQVTGDGATVLVARLSAGRVRFADTVVDFLADEYTVASSVGHAYQVNDAGAKLASGNAVHFAAIAVQHQVSGAISIQFVPGAVDTLANAVAPTQDEIIAVVGENVQFMILGDFRFYRSADTVIQTRVTRLRRPAYVMEDAKTGVVADQGAQASLSSEFCDYLCIPADLASISAVADNGAYINGMLLPNLPFGGYVKGWRYIPTVAGVGAGASIGIRLALDGVDMVGGDLTITEANSAIGQGVQDMAFSSANVFKSGDSLDVEIVNTATNFTGGSGVLQIEIWKYVE